MHPFIFIYIFWSANERVPNGLSWHNVSKWGNQWISLWTRMQPPPSCIPWFPPSFCGFYRDGSLGILFYERQWPLAAVRFNGTLAEPAEPHKGSWGTSTHYQRGVRGRMLEFYQNQRRDEAKLFLRKMTSSAWQHDGPRPNGAFQTSTVSSQKLCDSTGAKIYATLQAWRVHLWRNKMTVIRFFLSCAEHVYSSPGCEH